MKKTFKRLGAMFLAMVMAVSVLCTGAFAANNSITISTTSSGHTYEAYQVFAGSTGTKAEGSDKTPLSITGWGTGVNASDLVDALTSNSIDSVLKDKFTNILKKGNTSTGTDITDKTSADVAQNVAASIKDFGDKSTEAKAFAKIVAAHLSSTKADFTEQKTEADSEGKRTTTGYKAENLAAGYYLVKDKSDSTGIDAYTNYILEVVGNVQVDPKVGVPTVDKKVQNITAGETTGKDATTASIGDKVTFTLTGTLPDNYDDYKSYKYVFHDTLSKGLTCQVDSFKVYIQNGDIKTLVKSGYQPTYYNTNKTVTVAFDNLKATADDKSNAIIDDKNNLITINRDSNIIVEYSATLNEKAQVGSTGNENKVYLEYSNNPSYSGTSGDDPTGNTPESYVKVYTTGLRLKKVDGKTNAPLAGATFTIKGTSHNVGYIYTEYTGDVQEDDTYYYKLTDGTYTSTDPSEEEDDTYVKEEDGTYKKYIRTKSASGDTGFTATATVGADGALVIRGLGEGTYTITEIKAPDGYNKLETPITIAISANAGKDSCTWTVKKDGYSIFPDSDKLYVLLVENNKGSNLPSTGGMGTKLFYTIGGLLMAGAVIVLVIKKRRSSAE